VAVALALLAGCSDDGAQPPVKLGPNAEAPVAEEVATERTPAPEWTKTVETVPDRPPGTSRPPAVALSALRNATTSKSATEVTYRGTMTIEIAYYGFDCTNFPFIRDIDLHHLGDRTYEMPVSVIRRPPVGVGPLRESSPFNLTVSADDVNEGGIQLLSATISADEVDDDLVLYSYWQITQRGTRLEGRLNRSWREAGLAFNTFPTSNLIIPCTPQSGWSPLQFQPIVEGAKLTGRVTDSEFDLTVVGQTLDTTRRFRATVETSRVSRTTRTSTTRAD
jgi:hypothetical protein